MRHRHCGAGVGEASKERWVKFDVEVIVRGVIDPQ